MSIKSKFFTLIEFCFSRKGEAAGIDNSLPENLEVAASWTLAGADRVRWFLGHPITLTSGYRGEKVNALVGGEEDSQHLKAEAIDFVCPKFGTPEQIFEALKSMVFILGIDQLILERSWVHISFTCNPRGEVLKIL